MTSEPNPEAPTCVQSLMDCSFPKIGWRVALLLALWLPASPLRADGECAESAAERVQARYDEIRDLEADFEQTTRSITLGHSPLASPAPSLGKVRFSKPGKMRWEYVEPAPSYVVSDGKTLWLYAEGDAEAQKLPVQQGYLTGAALEFLLGEGNLLEEFEVSATGCGKSRVDLRLTPRKPASYERLGLTADAKSGDLMATSIVDLFGNETRIAFSNMVTNQGFAPGTFEFRVPPGVRVIELDPVPPK